MYFFVQQKREIFEKNFASLSVAAEGGRLPVLFSGLSEVHRAHLTAYLAGDWDGCVCAVCPDDAAAERFAKDLGAMIGQPVPVLAGREFTFTAMDAVSRQDEQRRLGVLFSLCGETPPKAVVCTAAGLLQRAVPVQRLRDAAFTLENGGSCAIEEAERRLLLCGFKRADQVEGPGQFARRGGILDFFSPGYDLPVRCEFWGDDIDSMGFFDPDTQRRTENIDRCVILPAAETLPSLYPGGAQALAAKLTEMGDAFRRRRTSDSAQVTAQTLYEDAEKLRGGTMLQDADRYMGVICGEFACALDYLPADALVVLSQPGKIAERAKAFLKQTGDDVKLLARSGRLAAGAGDFTLPWEAAVERLRDMPVVMADAFTVGRYPMEPRSIVSVTAKQLPSYGGSAQIAFEDAKRYVDRGFAVSLLAGDERRGKILTDALYRQGLKAVYSPVPGAVGGPGTCTVSPGSISAGME